ncbi:EAL domain-containing protein [Enterovirga sp.]|uniref:putative bifunctional diguanylate cyclase/phosphodiesterase n=1 Tax=Enterovirga sp. TaxID=2026350 RepID=UPI00261B6114|nr:EAL domain-containing protein [Enterovirga sp.]MDB5591629.1 hypothetical protein [Enterovirga sp.]
MTHPLPATGPTPFAHIPRFLIRHRASLGDLGAGALATAAVAFVCLEVDVFVEGAGSAAAKVISTDELPIIGAALVAGLLGFMWKRLRELKREVRLRRAAEEQVRDLAFRDTLTGLPNRRRFNDALKAAIAAPPRLGGAHALLTLDLNGFKAVNDLYGHAEGDHLLIAVARRLRSAVREDDLVARLGGDEFAIIAQHLAGPEAATGAALRVIECLREPFALGSIRHEISTGIGICLLPYADATPEETLRRSDIALYRAKAERRSALRFFDVEMDRHVQERAYLEAELRLALQRGDIRPMFQPLVDLKTEQVIGFEALARWTHSELGEVPPDRFIPIAEDTGQIDALSDAVLEQACRAAVDWPASTTLAFNISPAQLKDSGLGLRILAMLGRIGLPPHRLEIEITESALVRDLEAAQEILGGLREAGIRIALDDFGTGYSSLYHLRNFKLDKIKIDRSFVANMRSERESAEIVSALVGLGRGLGLTITAEGIEGEDEHAQLLAQGCQEGQGYLFSKAVSAEAARALFENHVPRLRA